MSASTPGSRVDDELKTRPTVDGQPTKNSLQGHLLWVVVQRSVGLVLSVGISLILVRALETAEFGYLSVGLALVSLATSAATLSTPFQIKLLTDHIDHRPHVYSSTGAVVAGASSASLITLAVLMTARSWPGQTATLTMVLAFGVCVLPLRLMESELQADLRGADLARMRWTGQGLVAVLLAVAWRTDQPTVVFAAVLVVGQIAQALVLLVLVGSGPRVKLAAASPTFTEVLRPAFPTLVNAVAITIYLRLDQVMLGAMSTGTEAGEYAAAVRLSELSYVIPVSVTFAVSSTLTAARKTGTFDELLESLLASFAAFAALTILVGVLLGPTIVAVVFGSGHEKAGQILQVHVLASAFVFIGTGSSIWVVNEHRESARMVATVLGAIINGAANFALIPLFGGLGAAWATVGSYAIASVGFNMIPKSTRALFRTQLNAFLPWYWPRGLTNFYRMVKQ